MAGNVNKVFLMGNLTRDIELRHTAGDNAVANFGIAINRYYKNRDGERVEEVTFVDCEAWGYTGENMHKYLKKGRPVFIEGRLKLDQWEDKDGNKRSKLRVVVDRFEFVDSREGSGGGNRAPQPVSAGGGGDHPPIQEDDIPF